ncbi:unnamed protein product [Caenorhabditis angaria]|uniref:Uncharacterized protein n=1 Tax=Caenorhabditis angaria TaxID=860376 RepID=A0A9P1IS13_9PELO|nr:unnamed protein product [Caenorhabditis angaria]
MSSTIQERLSSLKIDDVTSETVLEFEADVDEYLLNLERELQLELAKKRECANRIGVVQAQVSELWDRVDKARRRETDISYRVTSWAQQLAEQMEMIKTKKQQIGFTMDTSAQISAEIAENLERLAEKREKVQIMREEIDIRRKLHKQQLRDVKNDIKEMEASTKHWNHVVDKVSEAIRLLKGQRDGLVERLREELEQETFQKKMLEDLEISLRNANLINKQRAGCASSFSTITESY